MGLSGSGYGFKVATGGYRSMGPRASGWAGWWEKVWTRRQEEWKHDGARGGTKWF